MSHSLQQILTSANSAIARGDFEGFLRHCTEDTRWVFVGEQTLEGKAAVRAWMKQTYQTPPRVTVDRFIETGSSLVAMGTVTVRDDKGDEVASEYCDVWHFEGEKLAELHAYVVPLG